MKKELIDIINRLKASPSVLISVINKETGQPLARSFSNDKFVEKYGSVEAFFNDLVAQGVTQIIIEERRRLGNTTRSFSTPKTFVLSAKEEPVTEVDTPVQMVPAPMAQVAPLAPLAPMGLQGLGFPQIMDLHVKAHDQARLETENKFLKEKNERLEQEIATLKEERLENKYSEAKAKGNNEMLLGFMQNLPMLMGLFKGSPQGLQGVDDASGQLPPEKAHLFNQLTQTTPEVDSFVLKVLENTYESPAFYQELSDLLKKYESK